MSEEQNPVRLGVIGAGWFACRRHLPDAEKLPNLALTAICRRDPEAREKVQQKFGVPDERAFADWETMLDTAALDAVLIATPNSLHFPQAKACLERGLHVLLEKPMTIRSAESRELVALAAAKNCKLAVAHNPPFWAHCHRLKNAFAKPQMGALESASLYWSGSAEYVFGRAPAPDNLPGIVPPTMYRADPAQNGGGYLMDGGPHLISEIVWTTGLRVRKVTSLMDTLPMDMRIALALEMENGAMVTLNSIGDSKFHTRRVRNIFGTANGYATVEGFEFTTHIHIHGEEPRHFKEADLASVATPLGNFADAIQGKTALFSPGEHGLHIVEIIEAAYQSAATGRTITLP